MKRKKSKMQIYEMNRKIIRKRLKNPTYILTDLDIHILNAGEYKANVRMNNKKYKPKKKKCTKVEVLKF